MKKEDIIISMLESQGKRMDSLDENMEKHMLRTDLAEQRITKLERPQKALSFIIHGLKDLSVVTTAILIILRLLGKI